MRTKTTLAQKMPVECESKILEFSRSVISARRRQNIDVNQIANIDEVEVPVTFNVFLYRLLHSSFSLFCILIHIQKNGWKTQKLNYEQTKYG